MHHHELPQERVQNRAQVLGLEGGSTFLGRIYEEKGAAVRRQLAETVDQERRAGRTEDIAVLLCGWRGEIPLENGDMNAMWWDNGHGSVGELPLQRPPEIVVGPHHGRAGEDGRVEILVDGRRRSGSAGRRMR